MLVVYVDCGDLWFLVGRLWLCYSNHPCWETLGFLYLQLWWGQNYGINFHITCTYDFIYVHRPLAFWPWISNYSVFWSQWHINMYYIWPLHLQVSNSTHLKDTCPDHFILVYQQQQQQPEHIPSFLSFTFPLPAVTNQLLKNPIVEF